jgi:hypothetical protein
MTWTAAAHYFYTFRSEGEPRGSALILTAPAPAISQQSHPLSVSTAPGRVALVRKYSQVERPRGRRQQIAPENFTSILSRVAFLCGASAPRGLMNFIAAAALFVVALNG